MAHGPAQEKGLILADFKAGQLRWATSMGVAAITALFSARSGVEKKPVKVGGHHEA